MRKISISAFVVLALLVVGGGIFLATWKIPAPRATIEEDIPNARFAR